MPVYAGAEAGLLPPGPVFTAYFGTDGFGDFIPPGKSMGEPQPEHAANALARLARESPGERETRDDSGTRPCASAAVSC